jgi:hypothetical protein
MPRIYLGAMIHFFEITNFLVLATRMVRSSTNVFPEKSASIEFVKKACVISRIPAAMITTCYLGRQSSGSDGGYERQSSYLKNFLKSRLQDGT